MTTQTKDSTSTWTPGEPLDKSKAYMMRPAGASGDGQRIRYRAGAWRVPGPANAALDWPDGYEHRPEGPEAPTAEHPWLAEMPPAHCPEGCVVRNGDRIGVVTWNPNFGDWSITLLGVNPRHGFDNVESAQRTGKPTPQDAGWRHALDTEQGFGWVWLFIENRIQAKGEGEILRLLDPLEVGYREFRSIRCNRVARNTNDVERLNVASAFAAALR